MNFQLKQIGDVDESVYGGASSVRRFKSKRQEQPMNADEFRLNKELLKEISKKKK